jgi:hypothetical protein
LCRSRTGERVETVARSISGKTATCPCVDRRRGCSKASASSRRMLGCSSCPSWRYPEAEISRPIRLRSPLPAAAAATAPIRLLPNRRLGPHVAAS